MGRGSRSCRAHESPPKPRRLAGGGLSALLSLLFLLPATTAAAPAGSARETALGERVWVRPLSAHAWLVRSESEFEGFGLVESNAVLVAGSSASVLVDTPGTDAQTEVVLAWAARTLGRPVRHLVVTHWHRDRMGGLGAARARGVEAHAGARTRELARRKGLSAPERELADDAEVRLAGVSLVAWYPGHGHTEDNVVVWFPAERLLDGGCFVRSAAASDLGNVAEADPVRWAGAAAALAQRFPGAAIVVPGHGAVGGPELLEHTRALARGAR